ncbi:MAG TPA: DUF167 domain-containing protein [Desulfuromonadales bacterium]|nr:DUF167 domain-containing protein [Desulfuromonadales bacterium]
MTDWTFLRENSEGVVLDIFVQPRASRNEICGVQGDEVKVRLTSPPVDGAANKLCRHYFAKLLKISKGDVLLIAGGKSRHKSLLLHRTSVEAVRSALEPFIFSS